VCSQLFSHRIKKIYICICVGNTCESIWIYNYNISGFQHFVCSINIHVARRLRNSHPHVFILYVYRNHEIRKIRGISANQRFSCYVWLIICDFARHYYDINASSHFPHDVNRAARRGKRKNPTKRKLWITHIVLYLHKKLHGLLHKSFSHGRRVSTLKYVV